MFPALTHSVLYPRQGSDDESYVSDVSDNISEDNASVTDNVSRQSRSKFCTTQMDSGVFVCFVLFLFLLLQSTEKLKTSSSSIQF